MKAGLVGRFHVETTAAQKWYRFAAAITHHAAQKGFQRHHPCDNAARLSASAFAVRIKPAAAAASVKIPGMAGSQLLRNDASPRPSDPLSELAKVAIAQLVQVSELRCNSRSCQTTRRGCEAAICILAWSIASAARCCCTSSGRTASARSFNTSV
jgi:hypothetical protein